MTARRYFRLRAPWLLDPEGSASVSVRVDGEWDPLLVRVGIGRWGGSLPVDAGWALWRCLGEALRSVGEPPAWLSGEVEVALRGRAGCGRAPLVDAPVLRSQRRRRRSAWRPGQGAASDD